MNTCLIRNARIYHTATRSFFEGAILVENGTADNVRFNNLLTRC